jgi:hypothetical protein
MHPEIHHFLARLGGVVLMSLMPLVVITFVSIPLNLNRHPGDVAPHITAPLPQHMT